ncbi:MAG TPA: hypothetical protein VLA49_09860 [Anaerolineales bacterium]|nr:hypothetical protein [Anaerolineales bacterium]
MERTVPSTASEEVELYLRTYYSLLRSTAEVQIRTLEEVHAGIASLLHTGVRLSSPDMAAFIYSLMRLPACIADTRLVVMGQSTATFAREGFLIGETWQQVYATARRRRCFYDGAETLACMIASRSDIDDIIPMLTAYQIEWNKMHILLRSNQSILAHEELSQEARENLAGALEISVDDLDRLAAIWGRELIPNLRKIADHPRHLGVRLLSGSLSEYRRATHAWWDNIDSACPDLRERPVYFVSSNTHSLVNVLSGFALNNREKLVEFVERPENRDLAEEYNDIQSQEVPSSFENFLYYLLKQCQQSSGGQQIMQGQLEYESQLGILRIPGEGYFDVEAQVIDLARLEVCNLDSRIGKVEADVIKRSNALILNIDYPLGLAAYNILSEVAEHVQSVLGVYIMGKAATLNGVVGDVMICNVVHDEQSRNTYLFPNCFYATDVAPFLMYGTVLDNQKSVSVRGTFLQNARFMDIFYREGYTDIEMEAGPYLSAVYEMYRPKRHPVDEIVNLYELPFDLGMIHYASDTPLSKGKNLGVGSLSYYGVDSTYATTLAIARRILQLEQARLS